MTKCSIRLTVACVVFSCATAVVWAQPVSRTKGPEATSAATPLHRLALVVGNAKYGGGNELLHPVNNAQYMEKVLLNLGYEVVTATDLRKDEMIRTIAEYGKRLNEKSIAIFFYSGRIDVAGGKRYLMAIDSDGATEKTVAATGVEAYDVFTRLPASANKVFIVDGTYPEVMHGIAAPHPRAGMNSAVLFGERQGLLTAEMKTRYNLFTLAVLAEINEPRATAHSAFDKVRTLMRTRGHQTQGTWVDVDMLMGQLVFSAQAVADDPKTRPAKK